MVQHGLYVFGGHHTMTTLVKLQQEELPIPYDTPAAKPASWYRWPALVVALPGPLSDYVKYLDICSEFDNEPIALVPSFKDKVLKLRIRWEQRFGTYRGYEDAKRRGEVKEWSDDMSLALNLTGSAGHVGQMVQLVAQPRTLWEKFLRLLNGDYHAPKQDKQGKIHLVIFSFCFFLLICSL
jgi:hypothetical protein